MFFIILILSLFVFFKTLGYAIYEYSKRSNKISAVIITILAVIALVAPCVVTVI